MNYNFDTQLNELIDELQEWWIQKGVQNLAIKIK